LQGRAKDAFEKLWFCAAPMPLLLLSAPIAKTHIETSQIEHHPHANVHKPHHALALHFHQTTWLTSVSLLHFVSLFSPLFA
jgi:hypothetical protein